MLHPHDPCGGGGGMYLGDEGTYVCKAFSPRCYVIQKVTFICQIWYFSSMTCGSNEWVR